MSNELIKDKIVMDRKIGIETTQILLEGDIIVPDIKPDMSVILQTESNLFINKVEISNDRVNFMGRMDISILYLAKGDEKPVHSINVSEKIDDFINMEGITKDMWADAKATITNIDYRMLNDRKINYRAVVNVEVTGESKEIHEIIVDIDGLPENQCLKKSLDINKSIENLYDGFVVKDEISIPLGKPSIREVLQTSISVNNKETKVLNGKVNISGELVVTTLYRGNEEDSMVEFIENEIPFNGVIDVLNAKEGMFADVYLSVEDKYIQVKVDVDGEDRILEVEASIFATVKVSSEGIIQVLEDAYIINKNLDITKMPIKYPKLVSRNKNQTSIKEIVQIDEDSPDMLQIYRITGNIHLDNISAMTDKVVVEGVIETSILYVAESDATPLYSFETIVPYKQVIETKGTESGMNVDVIANIDHIGFNMLSGEEVEIRFLMSFNTQVNEEKELNAITDIEVTNMDNEYLNNLASITVYCVQHEDTLWNVAKEYNTSIEEIIEMNDLIPNEPLTKGQKIIIIKKTIN